MPSVVRLKTIDAVCMPVSDLGVIGGVRRSFLLKCGSRPSADLSAWSRALTRALEPDESEPRLEHGAACRAARARRPPRRPSTNDDGESRTRPRRGRGRRRRGRDELAAEAAPSRRQDPLKLYVRQIGDGRLLTSGEERELARRKDLGDEAAKRQLIESISAS